MPEDPTPAKPTTSAAQPASPTTGTQVPADAEAAADAPAATAAPASAPASTPALPPAAPAAPDIAHTVPDTGHTVPDTGYTADGVPTFDAVREKIESRYGTAVGAKELAEDNRDVRTSAQQFDARQKAAEEKLAEIRASMHKAD